MILKKTVFHTVLGIGLMSTTVYASADSDQVYPPLSKALVAPRLAQSQTAPMVNSLIVKIRPKTNGIIANEARSGSVATLALNTSLALKFRRHMSGGSHIISLPKPLTLTEARALAASIGKEPDIEYVEPDVRMVAHGKIPNDPGYTRQWHLDIPTVSNLGGINVPPVWTYGQGNSSVTVAVVDSGVLTHSDLGQVLPGYDFISDTNYSNDGDGRDDDPRDAGDWNNAGECGTSSTAARSSWHGTHIAGTIAAKMDNWAGGTGIAPNVRILPVRVLGKCGGTVSDIVDGMRWAAGLPVPGVPTNTNPAHVINMSLGGSGSCYASYSAAINEIRAAGKVVIASTGNDASQSVGQPANCSGVIAVTAHALDGDNAEYSNIGPGTTISAPGGGCGTTARVNGTCTSNAGIYSLNNSGTQTPSADSYGTKVGTSMATAHVSGIAALMLSVNPALKPDQVSSVLISSARPHPTGGICGSTTQSSTTSRCGAGLVDANAAVDAVSGNPVVSITPAAQVVTPGTLVTLTGKISPTMWHSINTTQWTTNPDNPQVVTLQGGNTSTTAFTLTQKGKYTFTLTATQDDNKSGFATAEVIVNSPPNVSAIPEQNVATQSSFNLNVQATDPDGDKLTYTAITLPSGASLGIDGVITWPTVGAPGKYLFEIEVSDGINHPKRLAFNVNVNAVVENGGGDQGGGGGSMDLLSLALLAVVVLAAKKSLAKRSD